MHTIVTQNAAFLDNPVAICIRAKPEFRRGGLARAAESVRGAGRQGDTVLIHMSPEEYEFLQLAWGKPTINPKTGLPEYFKLKKFVKRLLKNPVVSTLAPIAMNFLLPGVGGLIGQTLFGAASSAAKGGNPLLGAATGALGHTLGGGKFKGTGANATGSLSDVITNKIPTTATGGTGALAKIGDLAKEPALNMLAKTATPIGRTATQAGMEYLRGAEADYANALKESEAGPAGVDTGDPAFNVSLPQFDFRRNLQTPADYYTYGQTGGEFAFFDPNALPGPRAEMRDSPGAALPGTATTPRNDMTIKELIDQTVRQSQGRAGGGHVQGPGSGRQDLIDAQLSDGEYVMDAETVALLGDGSVDEGARRLDEMRTNLRKHKGTQLAKGKFSANAKDPEQYMAEGGKMRGAKRSPREARMKKLGLAKGGSAVAGLEKLANEFRTLLRGQGNDIRIKQIENQLEGAQKGLAGRLRAGFAKGGNVRNLLDEIRRSNEASASADIQALAAELRRLNPQSDVLRMYESDEAQRKAKRGQPRRRR